VGLDGADADLQVVGDLAVGPALGDRDQDLFLPAGEWLDGLCGFLTATGVREGGEQPPTATP
jgi:hypothetical protein